MDNYKPSNLDPWNGLPLQYSDSGEPEDPSQVYSKWETFKPRRMPTEEAVTGAFSQLSLNGESLPAGDEYAFVTQTEPDDSHTLQAEQGSSPHPPIRPGAESWPTPLPYASIPTEQPSYVTQQAAARSMRQPQSRRYIQGPGSAASSRRSHGSGTSSHRRNNGFHGANTSLGQNSWQGLSSYGMPCGNQYLPANSSHYYPQAQHNAPVHGSVQTPSGTNGYPSYAGSLMEATAHEADYFTSDAHDVDGIADRQYSYPVSIHQGQSQLRANPNSYEPTTTQTTPAPQALHYWQPRSRQPNPGYTVQPSHCFHFGRVLKIDWAEPCGNGNVFRGRPYGSDATTDNTQPFRKDRRFIIVGGDNGHSLCVTINTYGSKACTKKGVKPQHHGIIYTGNEPQPLDNEPELGYPSVKMIPEDLTEKLKVQSRVNYSKTYTIEHNWPVCFVGRIDPEQHTLLHESFTKSFNQMLMIYSPPSGV